MNKQSISLSNVTGALHNPKAMTLNWKHPEWVANAGKKRPVNTRWPSLRKTTVYWAIYPECHQSFAGVDLLSNYLIEAAVIDTKPGALIYWQLGLRKSHAVIHRDRVVPASQVLDEPGQLCPEEMTAWDSFSHP